MIASSFSLKGRASCIFDTGMRDLNPLDPELVWPASEQGKRSHGGAGAAVVEQALDHYHTRFDVGRRSR